MPSNEAIPVNARVDGVTGAVGAAAGTTLSTVTVDGADLSNVPLGGKPVTVAVFVTWPASMSAWVVTYEAVHVVVADGARVVTGQT